LSCGPLKRKRPRCVEKAKKGGGEEKKTPAQRGRRAKRKSEKGGKKENCLSLEGKLASTFCKKKEKGSPSSEQSELSPNQRNVPWEEKKNHADGGREHVEPKKKAPISKPHRNRPRRKETKRRGRPPGEERSRKTSS